MKQFCFTVDDNIRFLKELNEGNFGSLFDHPYLKLYRHLRERYQLRVQLNLFYEQGDFDLSSMSERYKAEWEENAHWLKLSFHSRLENVNPYENSDYGEVYEDCEAVHREILRFASSESLAKTTTVHYCVATADGINALKRNGVRGLLGLYGSNDAPRSSYQTNAAEESRIRVGETVWSDGMAYAGIDLILNAVPKEKIIPQLKMLSDREWIKVMIHEQYFYPDYPHYQADFEEKLDAAFAFLTEHGFCSTFFEDCL